MKMFHITTPAHDLIIPNSSKDDVTRDYPHDLIKEVSREESFEIIKANLAEMDLSPIRKEAYMARLEFAYGKERK